MKKLIIAIGLMTLAGCQTAEEMAAADDATCQGYGARPGSNAYIMCRSMAQDQRVQQDIARRARVAASVNQMNQNMAIQNAANTISRPTYHVYHRPPPVLY